VTRDATPLLAAMVNSLLLEQRVFVSQLVPLYQTDTHSGGHVSDHMKNSLAAFMQDTSPPM
jgi:hypothetical protein